MSWTHPRTKKLEGGQWSPQFATGLNIIIGIDQKIYEWLDCSFAKMTYSKGDHLAKGQLGHSYKFLTKPIMILSPVANFGDHPLDTKSVL